MLQRGLGGNGAAAPTSAATAREQASNELLETAKGLQVTQQQAVDQAIRRLVDLGLKAKGK